ncbi:MAG: HutP family protein [Synergistota bacterium]|nr:HutP family protein [Synergistota bacterium]
MDGVKWKGIFKNPQGEEWEELGEMEEAGRTEEREATVLDMSTPPDGQERRGVEVNFRIRIDDENQAGRAALLLASTTTSEAETTFKRELASLGWKSVATEVGGLAGILPQKITGALVGASLNAGVVEKKRNEMHALMHAALEALDGFLAVGMLEASVGAKIAIVRNSRWISVAVMGDTAYHAVAHHERCGLGVMHI